MGDSTTIVIFGASGDLTRRKLIPALFKQWRKGRLPDQLRIVGFAVTPWDTDQFQKEMNQGIQQFVEEDYRQTAYDSFCGMLHYVQGSFTESDDFARLEAFIELFSAE